MFLSSIAVSHAISSLKPSQVQHLFNMPLLSSPLTSIALLFLSYLSYRVAQGFVARKRFEAFAQQRGCEEPLDVTGPYPFSSWKFVLRLM